MLILNVALNFMFLKKLQVCNPNYPPIHAFTLSQHALSPKALLGFSSLFSSIEAIASIILQAFSFPPSTWAWVLSLYCLVISILDSFSHTYICTSQ